MCAVGLAQFLASWGIRDIQGSFMRKTPVEPIPEPLRGSEPDSFAYYTITVRFPRIINQVLQENNLPAGQQKSLNQLLAEIPRGALRPLLDQNAPDAGSWSERLQSYRSQDWLQAPWFLCETYFFRRIIEAVCFYEEEPDKRLDPYHAQKINNLDDTLNGLRRAVQDVNLDTDEGLKNALQQALIMQVWGNQTDLSMWPAGSDQGPMGNQDASHLLVNQAALIAEHLLKAQAPRVDLILDNAGAELTRDLLLADLLLSSSIQATIHFHAKPHPTYVSDATAQDVLMTITAFNQVENHSLQESARRLSLALSETRLQIHDDYFWTSPLSAWQMPDALYEDLSQAHLVISKGDANYRRLLGDRHWPFVTPFAEITRYRPAPLAALRVLKSEVACGLEPEQPAMIQQQDPDWLIDGRWGVIQFAH
jgi:uncharacterized protein with ATP-grasp and redox domains